MTSQNLSPTKTLLSVPLNNPTTGTVMACARRIYLARVCFSEIGQWQKHPRDSILTISHTATAAILCKQRAGRFRQKKQHSILFCEISNLFIS